MQPHVDVLTLGVRDLDVSRRFYLEGLKWAPALDIPGEVLFIQVGHGLLLALYDVGKLAAEAGVGHADIAPPMSLGHNVAREEDVDAVLTQAEAAGAVIIAPARRQSWGGVSGYFADPDGFRWEVVHNPGLTVGADGTVRFDSVEQ